eukprot:gnl/TRDRNA2_/TRDRNA2_172191_c1_seq3.p1 gnl/TRDRNA2_/TRDRNA2_172191_c1~~gnl/TRDRNA2_/TRDRNA2_172191_c1_seq3.p1  ORF type:complete len:370 (-),score=37.64 gnl/TRDRNA2_/TRDRNA2_172191_c1_seq3:319-1428(-)
MQSASAVSIITLSGLLECKFSIGDEKTSTTSRPIHRGSIRPSISTGPPADRTQWKLTVKELANRGFRLSALLHFYEGLPQAMPDFSKDSTTSDVVKHAIIPQSRTDDGMGVALATIWNAGQPVLPTRMVTHNWANRFRDLVAAIIAEALELQEFERIATKLSSAEGVAELKTVLHKRNVLDITYWVCAISVNQHSSICHNLMCTCNHPKFLNDEPRCEINKFDDMMMFLKEQVPTVRQVICVDNDFQLFWRAWCVAELVQANQSSIEQYLVIASRTALDANYNRLGNLNVSECQASRKEDKEYIISKIIDIDHFNNELQRLIFSDRGLFQKVSDATARATEAGQIARRARQRQTLLEGCSFVQGSSPTR